MNVQTVSAKSSSSLFKVLLQGGIAVLPSKLGFGILCSSSMGMEKLYRLKGRPKNKPTGVVGTPRIFRAITDSAFCDIVERIPYPIGLVEKCNPDSELVQSLPDIIRPDGTIAVFMNLDPEMENLADFAFEQGRLIIISSANKAGEGNVYHSKDLHPDFKKEADIFVDSPDLAEYQQKRGAYEHITTTMIDLTERKFLREGVFESRIYEFAVENGLVEVMSPGMASASTQIYFRSCIFLQAFNENAYSRIRNLKRADWFALDLQDGCPPDKKALARNLIEEHLLANTFEGKNVFIRLNELDAVEELEKDLKLNYNSSVAGFALPMLYTPDEVLIYEEKIQRLEFRLGLPEGTFGLIPIIETAEGLIHCGEIAKSSARNFAMLLGHADLFGDTHSVRNSQNLHYIRFKYLCSARAAGLKVFDTPFENVKDFNGFIDDCLEGRRVGFDGKVALTFDQLDSINDIFGISQQKNEENEEAIANYKGGCHMFKGRFLAPPIIRQLKNEISRGCRESHNGINIKGLVGKTINYGIDYRNAFPGQIIQSSVTITLDESWVALWHSLIPTMNPLETSTVFCRKLGLKERLMPFQALINLALTMVVETFSESCLLHLGIKNAEYELPVYPGDTLRSMVLVDSVRNTSSRKYSVFESRVVLLNQRNQRVLSMKRSSLFPFIEKRDSNESRSSGEECTIRPLLESPVVSELKNGILNKAVLAKDDLFNFQIPFEETDLILHSLVRPVGISASILFSNLCKNTHPLHLNNSRYGKDGLAVSGGFILPIILGAAARDFKHPLHQNLLDTTHINRTGHEDSLGAFSFVLSKNIQGGGIEELTIRTFGVKNLDIQKDLEGLTIPFELLYNDELKPGEIEDLLKSQCPKLYKKLVLRTTWKMWRKAVL